MVALKPPFRADTMDALYNRIIKGNFNKIPDRYSTDLFDIIKLLLQVKSESRPSCGK